MGPNMRRFKFKLKTRLASVSFLKIILIGFIILAFFALIYIYNSVYKPQIKRLAHSKGNYMLNTTMNEGIRKVISKDSILYGDLITVLKDEEGKITALMTNIIGANRLRSEFSLNISKELNQISGLDVFIPLGNLTGLDTLSGLGPKLKLTLIPAGTVKIDFKNSFIEAGINQTRHEIYLEAVAAASLLMPTGIYERVEQTLKIPLCESIIVGDIPDSITRLETRDETLRDDILNIY